MYHLTKLWLSLLLAAFVAGVLIGRWLTLRALRSGGAA